MRNAIGLLLLVSSPLFAQSTTQTQAQTQVPIQRIADDARVIDRVAEASKKDLPTDLLKRIVNENIDLLRGKRPDGSFLFATYERLEAGRTSNDYSIQKPKNDSDLTRAEMKGSWVYRLIVSSPSRRMLVTKNRRVWVDRIELEFIPENSATTRTQTVQVQSWMEPGSSTPVDFPVVARQATARVYARADADAGYGNIVMTLIHAKIVDNVDSPYAAAVATAKGLLRAVENEEIPSIRAMAMRLHDSLAGAGATARVIAANAPAVAQVDVVASPQPSSHSPETYVELQTIEDLLTGSEAEKREGLERLHQLIRKLRPR